MKYLFLTSALILTLTGQSVASHASLTPDELNLCAKLYSAATQFNNDPEKKAKLLTNLATRGYCEAQISLADMLVRGWRNNDGSMQKPDMDQIMHWRIAAAKNGHAGAQLVVGNEFEQGWMKTNGSRQLPDIDEAIKWYTEAANNGQAIAQTKLGYFNLTGWRKSNGTQQLADPQRGIQLLTQASAQGNETACYMLGCLFSGKHSTFGAQIAPNPAKALELWIVAANKGHPHAQREIDLMKNEHNLPKAAYREALALRNQFQELKDKKDLVGRRGTSSLGVDAVHPDVEKILQILNNQVALTRQLATQRDLAAKAGQDVSTMPGYLETLEKWNRAAESAKVAAQLLQEKYKVPDKPDQTSSKP